MRELTRRLPQTLRIPFEREYMDIFLFISIFSLKKKKNETRTQTHPLSEHPLAQAAVSILKYERKDRFEYTERASGEIKRKIVHRD